MKVLFIASNPRKERKLDLVQEITELQLRFGVDSRDSGPEIEFLPNLKIEHLPGELRIRRPDVLHIACHGERDSLLLSDERGGAVSLTAKRLRQFLPPSNPPRLIYLNACNSQKIAEDLVKSGAVPMSIGSTAPITNESAKASAVVFYEGLHSGLTVRQAFDTCKGMLEGLAATNVSVKLFSGAEANPEIEILHPTPRLIAEFKNGKPKPGSDDHYSLRLGILACPASTRQVLFFTDDVSFIHDHDTMENELCWLIRDMPVRGVIWTPEDSYWRAVGDHRLFATGVKAGGGCFALATTLCEAIENRFRLSRADAIPNGVAEAIKRLRENDGADLDPKTWDFKSKQMRNAVTRNRTVTKKQK